MIQYFSKSTELGPLKQIPNLKETVKIIRIVYPHNNIAKINPTISRAQNAEQIDLSFNRICNFDPIFDMRKLKIVNLSNNQIITVPRGILKLKKLQDLDLRNNSICNMSSVNVLIELFKVRKCQLKFHLEGNKVFQDYQEDIDLKIQKVIEEILNQRQKINNKLELKQLQISKTIQIKRKVYKNQFLQDFVSEMKEQQEDIHQNNCNGSLAQAKENVQNCLNSLIEFERKMEVIASSQFKGWNENLFQVFKVQSNLSKDLINAYKMIIKSATAEFTNTFETTPKIQSYFLQANQIQQQIKSQHTLVLIALSETDVQMMNYKIWVQLFRQLRNLGQKIRYQVWSVIHAELRNQQIQALKLISPAKIQVLGKNNQELQGLLFSKKKLMDNNQMNGECSECFIKSEETRQLREIVDHLTQENQSLNKKVSTMSVKLQRFEKNDEILGMKMIHKQNQIIQSINQKIDASVYQKILLCQARGIEDLIRCGRHQQFRLQQKNERQNKIQSATAIVKNKGNYYDCGNVSDFTCQDKKKQSSSSKRPYFNKNQISSSQGKSKSRKNTIVQITSTQKKNKKEDGLTKDLKQKPTNIAQFIGTSDYRNLTQESDTNKQNKTGNVLISDFVVTETGKQKKNQSSRKILAELINKKCNEENYSNLKNKMKSTNEMKKKQVERQQIREYAHYEYRSVNLKNEKPYEDYMKYHLRNSIIETLEKKGRRCSLTKLQKQNTTARKSIIKNDRNSSLKVPLQQNLNKSTSRLLQNSRNSNFCSSKIQENKNIR